MDIYSYHEGEGICKRGFTSLPLLLLLLKRLFSEDFGFVGLFPGEVKVVSTEVPITGSRSINRAAEVKGSDNGFGSKVKVLIY